MLPPAAATPPPPRAASLPVSPSRAVEPRSPAKSEADVEAARTLNAITVELQEGKISFADAHDRFTVLIDSLCGQLRWRGLLNRASCKVKLGNHRGALADIDEIVSEDMPGFD